MRLFEQLLGRHEAERHGRIRAAGTLEPHRTGDGFLPLEEAAAVMGVDLDTLGQMAGRGDLEWRDEDGSVLVRPAVVSRMAVKRLA
ncbi:MAG: hypothetical protein H0X39_12070 [Actinobacteria bacterium]|nr:hypothetical protein [Actinomycetota bacterium]